MLLNTKNIVSSCIYLKNILSEKTIEGQSMEITSNLLVKKMMSKYLNIIPCLDDTTLKMIELIYKWKVTF